MLSPPQDPLAKAMTHQLSRRRTKSSLRALTIAPADSIDFSSNDFLSLSTSSNLKTAFFTELQCYQNSRSFMLGSGGSRLLDGNSLYAERLERDIAAFHNAPAGLLFNSGFDANAGFFACVPQKGDVVVYDEFIHASVHEGMRLSRARKIVPFKHNCVDSLRRQLEECKKEDQEIDDAKRNIFVAVESLYSMDGDLSPLREIVEVVEKTLPKGNGHVIVDEAHSTGVYGSKGRGIVCSLGLEDRVFARLHTFGKALGCNGAIILCSPLTRTYLINYARPLIYTTFMSFPSLAAIRASYSLLMFSATEPLAAHLCNLIAHLYSQLQSLDRRFLTFYPSPQVINASQSPYSRHQTLFRIPSKIPKSPIFSILTSEPISLARFCQRGGFVVRAIVAPTVPVGTERVRVCLHAGNSFEEVERLVARMGQWVDSQIRPEAFVGRLVAKL